MPIPLMVSTIFETASTNPNKTALVCGDESISYEKLATKVRSAATFLNNQGVQRNDRVLLSAQNTSPTFAYGYFACHLIGAISVPIGERIGSSTLGEIVKQTQPRFSCLSNPTPFALASAPLSSLDSDFPLANESAIASPDDTADILFTAGTTGKPKGIMQTHRNIKAFADGRNSIIGTAARQQLLLPLSLNHGFGLGRLRSTMLAGGTVILVDGFAAPECFFRALEKNDVSGFCCVPSGFATLFELTGGKLGEYRNQLRYIETATAPLPPSLKEHLITLLPDTRIYNTYGLTEATSTIAFVDVHTLQQQTIPVGRPVPGVEIKIVNDEWAAGPAGARGQVIVRGDNVMKGYWGDPARTKEVLIDGWLLTNDIGFLDGNGYLHLVGRKQELINVGGLKVAPAEIEGILDDHPAIRECACVGIKDPAGMAGETIKAFLVAENSQALKPTDDELINFLRPVIESHKLPSQFVWVDALPKNAVGKLQRLRLQESASPAPPHNGVDGRELSLVDLIRRTFLLGAATHVTDEDGPGSLDGWDSLGNVKLILAIQDAYGICIEPSEAITIESVSDIRVILRNRGLCDL
jgi:acyl-CoA synthetase (AMP-forming)/AMP-acid ligase II/acyl carrier protein